VIHEIELAVAVYIIGYVILGRYTFRQLGPFKPNEVDAKGRQVALLTLFWPLLLTIFGLYCTGFGIVHLLSRLIVHNNVKH
jgi:hypothetical protein